jgi:hypothetical protein
MRDEGLQILGSRVHPLMTSETTRPRHGLDYPAKGVIIGKNTIMFHIKMEETTGKFKKQ